MIIRARPVTEGQTNGWVALRRRAASLDSARDAVLSTVEWAALLVVGAALLRLRWPPRAWRGWQLGPAQGTGGCGTGSRARHLTCHSLFVISFNMIPPPIFHPTTCACVKGATIGLRPMRRWWGQGGVQSLTPIWIRRLEHLSAEYGLAWQQQVRPPTAVRQVGG